jgi:hypothetical protein
MGGNPLGSIGNYSRFMAELLDSSTVKRSTLSVWSDSPYSGIVEGAVYFANGIWLRLREELDFDAAMITSYGYEMYRREKRLYWYDDFPHPNDPVLAPTFPHHKHVPPDIKRNRIPAPDMSFTRPNLAVLIQEAEELAKT